MERASLIIFTMVSYAVFFIINKKVKISCILYEKYGVNTKKRQFLFSIVIILTLLVFSAVTVSLSLNQRLQQLVIGIIAGFYFAVNVGLSRQISK
jgi:hypothetical protein